MRRHRDGLRRRRDGVSRRRGRRPRPQRRHRLARPGHATGGRAKLGVDADLAEALVCAAARETFEESGVLFAGRPTIRTASSTTRRSTASARARAGSKDAVVRRVPAGREAGAAGRSAAAVGELGDPQGGAHPPLRHLLLRRCTSRGPARRRREHRNRPGRLDHARGGLEDFTAQRTFLLPPTWTQLDSLAGRTVAEVLAVERRSLPCRRT